MAGSGPEADRTAGFELRVLEATHAVCRLGPDEELPEWARRDDGALLSVTRTDEELSIVCAEALPPHGIDRSDGWRALRVVGLLDFSLYGVLVSLAAPLAEAGIPIFAISSFDTDYLLVRADSLEQALEVLAGAGHSLP